MADNLYLTGPSGTTINVGSWLRPYDKPDYGAKSLVQRTISDNPVADGGMLAFEHLGPRAMAIPLIIPSSGTYNGLAGLESQLRLLARPGAVFDIQPDGMSDAVRFDVVHGRWEEDYDTYENRVMRRKGTLYLDTQPLGYLPTSILVASTASVGLPGSIDLSGVSFIGDAPGLAELVVQPTAPTSFVVASYVPDLVLWSLSARASSQDYWSAAASMAAGDFTTAFTSNAFGVGATCLQINMPKSQTSFGIGAQIAIPTTLEPAYRGRWRAFALAVTGNSSGTVGASLDAVATHNALSPLASAAPVAYFTDASGLPFSVLDMGEVSIPPAGSGLPQSVLLRFWLGLSATSAGASPAVTLNGIYLHSLDGANGVLARGLSPARAAGLAKDAPGRFVSQAYERRTLLAQTQTDLSIHAPRSDLSGDHRGGFPLVAGQASTNHLDLMIATRQSTGTSPPSYSAKHFAAASLSYRPRFYFLHGL